MRQQKNIERTLVWVIAAVGGGAVALAGLIFFASAVASGAIPPVLRVLAGLGVGAGALVGGEVLWRRQAGGPAAAMSGAGAGLLLAALYASAIRYGLLPVEVAFVLMSGVTGLTAWRADQHRSALLAGMALIAGFATPLMLSTGENRPVLLIGYLAVLNAGLLVSATRQQWRGLIAASGALTLLMLSGWAVRFLTPAQTPAAVLGAGLLSAVFLVAAAWRREPDEADRLAGVVGALLGSAGPVFLLLHGSDSLLLCVVLVAWVGGSAVVGVRRQWPELALLTGWLSVGLLSAGAVLSPGGSTILAAMLLGSAGLVAAGLRGDLRGLALPGLVAGLVGAGLTVGSALADTPLLLIELLALGGLAAVVSLRRDQPWLLDLAAVALVVLTALSDTPLLTGGVLAVCAGLGARWVPRAGLWAPVLGAAGLAVPVVMGTAGLAALPGLLVLAVSGVVLASRLRRPLIAVETAVLVGGLQVLVAATGALTATPAILLLLLAPPLITAASTRAAHPITGSFLASLIAGGLMLTAAPEPLLLAPALAGIGLAVRAPVTLPMAVLYGVGGLLALGSGAPVVSLSIGWGLTLATLALPALRSDRITHQTAILAGGAFFAPLHLAWQAQTGGAMSGLQPALIAGLTLAAAIRARRAGQQTALAELLVLGFATAALIIQLSGPWLVLGLAAEVLALAELQRRQPMVLLRSGAVVLAAAVCALLLNPVALQWSFNPLIWALPAAALLWSGERLRGWHLQPARGVQLGGAVLLFAAVDLTILGLFGGEGLRIASVAGEMVRSLAWAGFGLAMMGAGVRLGRKPVRMLALAALCLAAGKVFLADLWQLHGLVRVGSIMGLGVFLLVAAVLLQRVVLTETAE